MTATAMDNSPRVLNANIDDIPPGAVWVDRRSPYGNPFRLGVDGDVAEVTMLYVNYLLANPLLIEDIKTTLRGKDLVCHCHPEPCHAALILKLANDPDFELMQKKRC